MLMSASKEKKKGDVKKLLPDGMENLRRNRKVTLHFYL